jgi:3-hydroxyacyl-CoA dehydrogenase/enoyl-CoA hydratase/3-hydroxybutyryl-CoA epimerase
MADTNTWSLEFDADRVAWLTCDTPGTSTNVLSAGVLRDLSLRLADIAAKRPVGVVICSAKTSGFIAGADIKEFLKIRTPEEGYELVRAGQSVLQTLAIYPAPALPLCTASLWEEA